MPKRAGLGDRPGQVGPELFESGFRPHMPLRITEKGIHNDALGIDQLVPRLCGDRHVLAERRT